MAFSFGGQASSASFGGFGAAAPASSGGFGGFGAAPAPAFGASSAPAFGAPAAASSGGFGFGASSTPAFGAPAASGGGFGFGGSSTPAFGAPAANSGGFGFGGASTPAFGAASSGSSLFGAAAPAASSGGFGFGGASTPAFGAASPFGAPAGGSLFGAPAASTGTSLFGAPATSSALTIFGGGAPGAAPGAAPAGAGASPAPQFAPVALSSGAAGAAGAAAGADAARELQEIANCYTPGHSSYKFSHLFLSVVRPEQRVRPPGVDELSWKQGIKEAGGVDNADGLWPVQANGFGDLLKRSQAQATAIDENRQRLSELRDLAHKLGRRQESELHGRIRAIQARHVELSQRLLGVARCVDGLEGRLAMYMGVRGDVSREREAAIGRTLDAVEGELSLAAAGGLQRRADVVASAVRLRASGGALGPAPGSGGAGGLDATSMEQLFVVLKDHADALQRLQDVLRRDELDVDVMGGSGGRDQTAPAGLGMAVLESA